MQLMFDNTVREDATAEEKAELYAKFAAAKAEAAKEGKTVFVAGWTDKNGMVKQPFFRKPTPRIAKAKPSAKPKAEIKTEEEGIIRSLRRTLDRVTAEKADYVKAYEKGRQEYRELRSKTEAQYAEIVGLQTDAAAKDDYIRKLIANEDQLRVALAARDFALNGMQKTLVLIATMKPEQS